MRTSAVLLLLLLVVAPLRGDDTASPPRSDLNVRSVYWQVLASDVRSVTIDPGGRAWFELDGNASVEQIKAQVERAGGLEAPWVKSARILLFDSAGRVWLTAGPGLLLGFDPKSKTWIERPAISSSAGGAPDVAGHAICGPAIEDGDGRVYVGDRGGCHVFDHGAWSYQPFYALNIQKQIYFGESRQFYVPTFARDDRGRIFAWTQWGPEGCTGTLGFWVHEGSRWNQTLTNIGERPGRIAAVVPLPDRKVLVCPEMGRVAVAWVDFAEQTNLAPLRKDIDLLGSRDFRQRRDAEHRILKQGPHVLPELHAAIATATSPEQRNRLERAIMVLELPPQQPTINDFALTNARLAGRDARGYPVLWADTVGPDGRAGRTAAWVVTPAAAVLPAPDAVTEWAPHSMLADRAGRLFLARYQKGLGVIDRDGKVKYLTDETDIPFDEILGQDRAGRVYVRNRWHVGAINLDVADTRRALPVVVYDLSASRAAACQDARGQTVAKLSGADHPFLSVYRNGRFADVPVPAGSAWISDVAYLQPLRDGALVSQEQPGGDVFYFDGAAWSVHRSFRALVEKQYAPLVARVDNSRSGVDTYASLRVDARKNVWCVQWDHVDVYDGKQWRTHALAGDRGSASRPILYCLPLANTGRVVISDGTQTLLAELAAGGIKTSVLGGARTAVAGGTAGLRVDSRGRAWVPRTDDSATLVENDQARAVPDTGIPRLEDSAGRIWFANLARRRVVALDRNGAATSVAEDALSEDSTIVEETPASYWVNTRSGLRHLLADANGKLTLEGDYYEKGLPKGPCNGMWIDANRSLWFSGSGRLYRIDLP